MKPRKTRTNTKRKNEELRETDIEALDDVKLRTIAANLSARLARAGAASTRLAQHEASLSPYHLTTCHAGRARGRSRSPGRRPAARKTVARHHAHGGYGRRQINPAQCPGRRHHRPGILRPAHHARSGRLLSSFDPDYPPRPGPAILQARRPQPACARAEDPR